MKMHEPGAPSSPASATLAELEQHDAFIGRHIGPSAAEQAELDDIVPPATLPGGAR